MAKSFIIGGILLVIAIGFTIWWTYLTAYGSLPDIGLGLPVNKTWLFVGLIVAAAVLTGILVAIRKRK